MLLDISNEKEKMSKGGNIDRNLLEKYFRNECSLAEQKLVEEWLEADTDEVDDVFPSIEAENSVKTEIWQTVTHRVRKRSAHLFARKTIFQVATAACVSLFLISTFVTKISSGKDGIIEPSHQTLQFCEKLVLTPEMDQEITFVSNCEVGNEISHTVKCKKGETYLALNFKFRNDNEIIVVSQNQLHSLPHDLRIKVMRELNS